MSLLGAIITVCDSNIVIKSFFIMLIMLGLNRQKKRVNISWFSIISARALFR